MNRILPSRIIGLLIMASSAFYIGCTSTETSATVKDTNAANPSAPTTPGLVAAKASTGFDSKTFVKPTQEALKNSLSDIQYKVTQNEGTERAFDNAYWDNKAPGLYVDVVSGEPLYSSRDKFKSGTGWPSFTRPLKADVVVEKEDSSIFSTRTEIRSRYADSHVGHVFDDGPAPTGKRYCMNSAAMRFIPLAKMEEAGYGNWINEVKSVS